MSALTPAERRFLVAKARAHRLHAQAHAAEAEADLLNPWLPSHVNERHAAAARAVAATYIDRAAETESEAVGMESAA